LWPSKQARYRGLSGSPCLEVLWLLSFRCKQYYCIFVLQYYIYWKMRTICAVKGYYKRNYNHGVHTFSLSTFVRKMSHYGIMPIKCSTPNMLLAIIVYGLDKTTLFQLSVYMLFYKRQEGQYRTYARELLFNTSKLVSFSRKQPLLS
jgi:hypothetical protein